MRIPSYDYSAFPIVAPYGLRPQSRTPYPKATQREVDVTYCHANADAPIDPRPCAHLLQQRQRPWQRVVRDLHPRAVAGHAAAGRLQRAAGLLQARGAPRGHPRRVPALQIQAAQLLVRV